MARMRAFFFGIWSPHSCFPGAIVNKVMEAIGDDRDEVIDAGETVVVQMHNGACHMLPITQSKDQKVGKSRVAVRTIIGCPYGTVFEVI